MSIALSTTVRAPFADAVARTRAALAAEGFGVLTEIDMKATLTAKLGQDAGDELGDYLILGACNPPLAHRALTTELELGLLLPCNVIVYEDDSGAGSVVAAVDPHVMLATGVNPDLLPVADEVAARLGRVLAALAA